MAILKHSLITLQFDVCLLFVDVIQRISLAVNCFVPHRLHICVLANIEHVLLLYFWCPGTQLLHDKMLIAAGIKLGVCVPS